MVAAILAIYGDGSAARAARGAFLAKFLNPDKLTIRRITTAEALADF